MTHYDAITKQARQTLLATFKLVVLCLMLFLLWTGNSWAQIPDDTKISPIVEKLIDNNARVRLEAHDALVSIGSPAVPALIDVLKNPDFNIRWRAAWVLGDMASEANLAVGALAEALQDEDAQVRMYAALALGEIGKAAKPAVPTLMAALQDKEEYVRIYAAAALRRLGGEAKVAVPSLMNALKDKNPRVRKNAALALGTMGSEATPAVADIIPLLKDAEYYVRYAAVKGLSGIIGGYQDIANNLPSTKLIKVISQFEQVLKILEANQDKFTEFDVAKIRRPLEALKAEKETRLFDRAVEWLLQHKLLLGIAAYITLLPSLWLILLRVTPLWLLKINNALKPYTDFSLPFVNVNVPLRYVLFVGWFHYHPQVLDAWVEKYMNSVREQFPKKDTVSSRTSYIPIPVVLNGNTVSQLTPENLRATFDKKRSCLVICGEGGIGKTSLACQIASWAIAETKDRRLCEHLMLPVLLEEEFRIVENKSSLLEAIRGQLQALIDEPEPICAELLTRLLRKQRILVIVDRFSELKTTTREAIGPDSPEFPVNALVITSRIEEKLGRVNKTTIKPLRIEANKLSSFMEAYLMQRGKRDVFTDQEFFDACSRLSLMVGQGNITVLLAKLYGEQLITAVETRQGTSLQIPENIPNLMLGYLNELNRDVTTDKLDDRTLHQYAKILAWECLQANYQPGNAKRTDAIAALTSLNINEPEKCLEYLENCLHLIQTIGSAKDEFRFCLDPLAEYLAALYIVEQYGNNDGKWRSLFFRKADDLVKTGNQDTIQGFLLAVRDCYLSQVPNAKESDFISQKLGKLAGYTVPVNTSINPVISTTP
ncbi:HEAT repeat domain-containing protein [Dendronalium sp. ChiSLP03b]|uniref:HEAT repeat domain-containing protein n=1 Tax=Dendronalium sp. ChiSLP03b TaxID=3075381 RepID=UPI002AD37DB1|nr:HEAT repeat domain-containing protein [Dendronalium sp. ChiSLP03b]MDZ8202786.1 HEAT repeat domain-containing protein [Dendronalium sp. ChiSLP03b]